MRKISISRGGQGLGSYTQAELAEQILSGNVVESDLAWYEGMDDWAPVSTLPGIAELRKVSAADQNVTPPSSTSAVDDYISRKMASDQRARRAKVIGLVAAIPVVLIGAWLAATWVFGGRVEEQVSRSFEELAPIAKELGAGYDLEITSYERGLFSSKMRVSASPSEELGGLFSVPLETIIYHGPLAVGGGGVEPGTYRSVTVLDYSEWDSGTVEKIKSTYKGEEPIRIVSQQSLAGEISVEGRMASVTFDSGSFQAIPVSDAQVAFSGAEFSAKGFGEDGVVKILGSCDGLSIDMPGEDFGFNLGPASFSVDNDEVVDGIITSGVSRAALESAKLSIQDMQLDLSGGTYENSNKIGRDGRLEIRGSTNVGELRFVSTGATPMELEGALSLNQSVKGIALEPMAALLKALKKMREFAAESEVGVIGATSNFPPEIEEELSDAGLGLFVPGIAWEFDLAFTQLDKDANVATFEIEAGFFGEKPLAQSVKEGGTLRPVFDALTLKAEAFVSDGLLEETSFSETADDAIEGGMLLRRGEKVGMRFKVENGKAEWNGNEIPLPEMLEAVLDAPQE